MRLIICLEGVMGSKGGLMKHLRLFHYYRPVPVKGEKESEGISLKHFFDTKTFKTPVRRIILFKKDAK